MVLVAHMLFSESKKREIILLNFDSHEYKIGLSLQADIQRVLILKTNNYGIDSGHSETR